MKSNVWTEVKHQQKIDAMMSGRDFALIRIGIILLSLQKRRIQKLTLATEVKKYAVIFISMVQYQSCQCCRWCALQLAKWACIVFQMNGKIIMTINLCLKTEQHLLSSCLRWARRVERHYVSGPLIALSTRCFNIKWRRLHDGAKFECLWVSVLVAWN